MIHEKNQKIRKMNDQVLNILKEYNQDLCERVKERRFYQHNKEWIESMEDYEKNFMGNMDEMGMQANQQYMSPTMHQQ